MLKMRLKRVGRKGETAFRLVLTESTNSSKSGRFKELLGSYDPRKTTEVLKADRVKYWLSKGVIATGTVNNLLVKKGILRGKKNHVGSDFVVKEAPAPVEEAVAPEVQSSPEAPSSTPEASESAPESTVEETPAPAAE